MESKAGKNTVAIAVIGALIVAAILIIGTIWTGLSAKQDSESAAHSVSLLYLDELAGRRERVVASNLQRHIENIDVAVGLMDPKDISSIENLQAYQARMKKLYNLEKFAFVDEDGTIYTSQGTRDNIDDYSFDYRTISEPDISILNLETPDKKVVIAVPVDGMQLEGHRLTTCFMEIGMDTMLQGVSMKSSTTDATFCNIYTADGVALSNTVLGGLAEEDNLLDAMNHAVFLDGYTQQRLAQDFAEDRKGEVSFTYDGIQETLSYVPVEGTDWMLTYLIRESVISDQIGSVSDGIVIRSLLLSLLMTAVLVAMFTYIVMQMRRNSRLAIEKETADAANRVKHQELEQRLALQERLLADEKQRTQQSSLISALSADYWSVYYLELDQDEGVCYQAHGDVEGGLAVGEHFPYLKSVTAYCDQYVIPEHREEFLEFVQPENVRAGLAKNRAISHRYQVRRHGRDTYEMVRFARVQGEGAEGEKAHVNAVGACFTDVDAEMRRSMEQSQALSDALATAEQANRAKTAFLSNMSHEIRTPMNAIIGLDSIALNEPDLAPSTREYLEKIGASAEHLLGLINDILDMSRIESGRLVLRNEEFSFPKLLEAINTMFSSQCHDKGLDYTCHINGTVADYYIGDNMKLRQVLINILSNAVKFTPEGGKVDLMVERTAQYEGKSTLCFEIADTGVGMSEEFLPHIFDAFAQEDSSMTSKYGSSGLGLDITKNIVEMMNGNIQVQSRKGEGTTFTVTLTLRDSERTGREPDEEMAITPDQLSVLVVDDDPVACEHAKLVLEHAGIAAEVAGSGEEALTMVQLRHARREAYNLILMDWRMPQMDGVEATRRIRSIVGDDSAIIILTAYRWDDVLEEALEAGVDSFISKPLFANTVLDEFTQAHKKRGFTNTQSQKADLAGRRILLAEDVPVNAEIMTMVLEMRQMQVELAENGRIALQMFQDSPEGYYDAVLMDMRMPEMDGLEATRRIRALDRADVAEVPIIALTANAFDEDVQRSLQAGLNAHLSKPVQPESLYETLESLIKP